MRALLAALSVVLLALTAVIVAVIVSLAPAAPDVAKDDTRTFIVDPGSSLGAVARGLEAAGLVKSARATKWLGRYRGAAGQLRAGEYALSPGLSSGQILDRLTQGRVVTYEVVLPEGIRATAVAARLAEAQLADAEAFLAVVFDPLVAAEFGVEGQSLEGYLFPETYRFSRGLEPKALARAMTDQFLVEWRGVAEKAAKLQMSMSEVVTLASIVEKETGAAEERPVIASVFLNRLDRGMRLETDPAVIYGIENFDGNIKKRHLLDPDNPYNTYRHPGLPPGPIANPGLEALRAVVEPAQSTYLYFVSMNDGTHQFSRSYREHVNAVNRYQKRKRSR